ILSRFHEIPFYVASPVSSFDRSLETGDQIPIEERNGKELRIMGCNRLIPDTIKVYNPAFDVTPANLISAIITEKGCIIRPDAEKISGFFQSIVKE
ncbi:MAG TPA: S-methyl-5-thioribose-1-phosphate isomerase, partial [Synergistales bacterium]|nr:S-methyl-5-thioribose-1-phosphate isomerase [Synergistales bacterium]